MTLIWELTPKTKTIPKLNNPLLIEGLPGIGNVGKIAVDFLIEELKAVRLYTFFSYKLPNVVFINEKNLVDTPRLELYYVKLSGSKRDLLLLTGEIQPIDEESCYSFCEEAIKIAKQFKCAEIVTTGGIGLQHIPEKPRVFCTSNDAKLLKEYLQSPLLEREIFGIVGPIMGVSGVLIGLGKQRHMPGAALLAETFGHPMYLGVKGAKEIIRVLEERFKFGLDLKRMGKEIMQVEQELLKKTKEIAPDMMRAQAGAKVKSKEPDYIG